MYYFRNINDKTFDKIKRIKEVSCEQTDKFIKLKIPELKNCDKFSRYALGLFRKSSETYDLIQVAIQIELVQFNKAIAFYSLQAKDNCKGI